jgi:hypothetical protein
VKKHRRILLAMQLTPGKNGRRERTEFETPEPTRKPRITEDLFTQQTFRDFELAFDWRISSAATAEFREFNHSSIVVRGNHTEHWLNGVKVVDSALDSPEALAGTDKRWSIVPALHEMLAKQPKKDCPISLQNYGDESWSRDITIRNL